MISVGNNKAVICKGDFHPAALYKGDKKIAGYTVEDFEGTGGAMLENCYNDKLHNAQIFGNSIQDGTPTPEAPIEVQSVGELVTEGEYAGKYKIPVRARGKNLLYSYRSHSHIGNKVTMDGSEMLLEGKCIETTSNVALSYSSAESILLEAGKTYALSDFYISGECINTVEAFYIGLRTTDNNWVKALGITSDNHKTTRKATFTVEEDTLVSFGCVGRGEFNELRIGILLEEGSTTTEYEPYIEPQTFNIYLDEPLRKVGDYADYVNFGKDVVVRSVKHKVFNGTEWWEYDASTNKNTLLYQERVTSCVDLSPDRITAMSSRVGSRAWGGVWQNYYKPSGSTALVTGIATVYNKGDGAGGKWLYLKVSPYSTLPTLEEWKAQLAIWYDEGNPFTVWYVIPTIEEPIELPELPTFKGTTIYEIDTEIPATISGKYKKVEV